MVGIVIVSHSAQLAAGVRELADQMVQGQVPIAVAGGIDSPENPIGTDPMLVVSAIQSVYSEDGVVVLMDLGSALLSAETALEFLPEEERRHVRLCSAPLVEGTLAAAVQASVGGDVEAVVAEAAQAWAAKQEQFDQEIAAAAARTVPVDAPVSGPSVTLTIQNPQGLHARPAAQFVTVANRYNARISVQRGEKTANAKSINQVATLGARQGDTVTVTAGGPDAEAALAALEALVQTGFGEVAPAEEAPAVEAQPAVQADDKLWQGIAASPGVAVGPAARYQPQLPEVEEREVDDPAGEWMRLRQAIAAARAEIEVLQEEAVERIGAGDAAILGAHTLILQDPVLLSTLETRLREERLNAEAVWQQEMRALAGSYEALDDAYMQARAVDVRDVADRVLGQLLEQELPTLALDAPAVLVAADLTPSDTIRLDTTKVLGICTERGGPNSHSAIMARALGIPAVVGLGAAVWQLAEGQMIGLDGRQGLVWPQPTKKELARLRQNARDWQEARALAQADAVELARLRSGERIEVAANIGRPQDAHAALENGAEGVGLFRTEFLFLERRQAPDEEEQVAAYRRVAELMGERPVIIRTLDVGGDKPLPYLPLTAGDNPFLGLRGIRVSLAHPELFKTQLRAVLRASHGHNVKLMFPMISSVGELLAARAALEEAQEELRGAEVPFNEQMEVGIMVEVPAAVALADQLAAHVNFFSIGTNDLTQYVMAADRGNAQVAELVDALHPAVLRLMAQTVEAGRAAGIWVGICGELAGNPLAAAVLVGLGLEELSMNAPAIPAVKAALRELTMEEARQMAEAVLGLESAGAVLNYLQKQ